MNKPKPTSIQLAPEMHDFMRQAVAEMRVSNPAFRAATLMHGLLAFMREGWTRHGPRFYHMMSMGQGWSEPTLPVYKQGARYVARKPKSGSKES